jgi:dTDP-4-amino-4,6-dideoxygalactose transaminase
LPIFPGLNDSEVDRIAAAIGNIVSTHRKRVLVPAA